MVVNAIPETCPTCDRRVSSQGLWRAKLISGTPTLPPADFCRWCARPCSEQGERIERDNARVAFLNFARQFTGRSAAKPTRGGARL